MNNSYRDVKRKLSVLWRRYGYGRLYWRDNNRKWYRSWNKDVIAMAIDGGVRTEFKSIEALKEMIEDLKWTSDTIANEGNDEQ